VFDPESFVFAMRMREIRVRERLKQAEVARRMGLDPSMISLWERGKRLVAQQHVYAKVQNPLGVSVEELRGQAPVAPTGQVIWRRTSSAE
jgi:transcriptional regulator with XRE-family HTH domain